MSRSLVHSVRDRRIVRSGVDQAWRSLDASVQRLRLGGTVDTHFELSAASGDVVIRPLNRLGELMLELAERLGSSVDLSLEHIEAVGGAAEATIVRGVLAQELLPLFGSLDEQRALLKSFEALHAGLRARRDQATEAARAAVAAYSEQDWERSLANPAKAADLGTSEEYERQLAIGFERDRGMRGNVGRAAAKARACARLLAYALRAEEQLATPGRPESERRRLLDEVIRAKLDIVELVTAFDLYRGTGLANQGLARLKMAIAKALPASVTTRVPGLGRETPEPRATHEAFIAPTPSGFWQPRELSATDILDLHSVDPKLGDTRLVLGDLRKLDRDGMHPSAGVRDAPARGRAVNEYTLKLFSDERPISWARLGSLVLHTNGYHSEPIAALRRARVEPRVLIAAYRMQNKIGIESPRANDAPPGTMDAKLGLTWFSPDDVIDSVTLRDGSQLEGGRAAEFVKALIDHPERPLEATEVIVKCVDLELERTGDRIAPWSYGDLGHQHRPEVQASLVAAHLLGGAKDFKLSNNAIDAVDGPNERPELRFTFSDPELELFSLPRELTLPPRELWNSPAIWLHDNTTDIEAWNMCDWETAKWGVENLVRSLPTKDHFLALAVSSSFSFPAARYLYETLLARRDALVEHFGIEAELFATEPYTRDLRGGGTFTFEESGREVTLPEGNWIIQDGELVPVNPPSRSGVLASLTF